MKQSIRQQVVIRIAVIFVVLGISGVVILASMDKVRGYSTSTDQATDIHSVVLTAQKAHYGWVENLCSAIALGTEFTGSTDYRGCVLGKWLYSSESAQIEDSAVAGLVEEMKPIHQAIHESAQKILDTAKTDHEGAVRMYRQETKANVDKLVALLDQVAEITQGQMSENHMELVTWVFRTEVISVFAVLATLAVSVMLVMYVMKKIISPIQVITESSRGLSEGRLDFQIDIKNKDEIGQLADSLNVSVKNLNLYISDISQILQQMADGDMTVQSRIEYVGDFIRIRKAVETIGREQRNTLQQIYSSAAQVDSGANQVSIGAQNLAQGSTQQASEVDNLQTMIERITDQIDSNAQSAAATMAEVDKMGEKITVCSGQMQEMTEAMSQISTCSGEIQQIIKTVDDIAVQTNILAINAAVEAARAGAAGKGFAVVADEVRNLAAKSSDAVKDTTELIERTLRMVETGTTLTDATQESLHSVVEGAGAVTSQIKAISDASKEQEAAMNRIKDGIYQISTVVQSNSATSQESAAASQELAGQAQVLKSLIGKFKL